MKKLVLGVAALIGACSMADANTLTINNNTGCTYNLSISGAGGSTAAPGTSTFTSTNPAIAITSIKIMFNDVNGGTIQLNVGNGSPFASSLGLANPACPTQFNYVTAIWQLATNGDVVLTIM